jgi:hypothetical protein
MQAALNEAPIKTDILDDVIDILKEKIASKDHYKASILENRQRIGVVISKCTKEYSIVLTERLGVEVRSVYISEDNEESKNYTLQMGDYASQYGYFFKRKMPRHWATLNFRIDVQKFKILIFLHHFGQTDDVINIGGVLESSISKGQTITSGRLRNSQYGDMRSVPIAVPPLSISLLSEVDDAIEKKIKEHIGRLVSMALADVTHEI